MDSKAFDEFTRALKSGGTAAAFARLIANLREQKEFHRVFDALTLQARHELGIPLVQATTPVEYTPEKRQAYEDRALAACREVGQLFLADGNIPAAFQYFNMIGELDPVRAAIDQFRLPTGEAADGNHVDAVIEIAVGHQVNPEKGLALILERYGTCQSITACEGVLSQDSRPAVREGCVKLLVRALYQELLSRLSAEVAEREGTAPAAASIALLLGGRDWLFENDNYHIDTSHLNAVVRMARLLPKSDELFLAIQLCEYGRRLSDRYRYTEPPPFEDIFDDTLVYLKAVAGLEITKGIEHFQRKVESAADADASAYAAEVLVNLLLRLGRADEALTLAARKLNARAGGVGLSCPPVNELCMAAGRFDRLAQLARERGDLVSFAAGQVLQASNGAGTAGTG